MPYVYEPWNKKPVAIVLPEMGNQQEIGNACAPCMANPCCAPCAPFITMCQAGTCPGAPTCCVIHLKGFDCCDGCCDACPPSCMAECCNPACCKANCSCCDPKCCEANCSPECCKAKCPQCEKCCDPKCCDPKCCDPSCCQGSCPCCDPDCCVKYCKGAQGFKFMCFHCTFLPCPCPIGFMCFEMERIGEGAKPILPLSFVKIQPGETSSTADKAAKDDKAGGPESHEAMAR